MTENSGDDPSMGAVTGKKQLIIRFGERLQQIFQFGLGAPGPFRQSGDFSMVFQKDGGSYVVLINRRTP